MTGENKKVITDNEKKQLPNSKLWIANRSLN